MPSPQTEEQREFESRIREYGSELAKKQGLSRRVLQDRFRQAAAFVAMNDTTANPRLGAAIMGTLGGGLVYKFTPKQQAEGSSTAWRRSRRRTRDTARAAAISPTATSPARAREPRSRAYNESARTTGPRPAASRFVFSEYRFAYGDREHRNGDRDDEEKEEQDLREARGAGRDAGEAEESRDERDQEEDEGPLEHRGSPSRR
jgi:hypothetical protein